MKWLTNEERDAMLGIGVAAAQPETPVQEQMQPTVAAPAKKTCTGKDMQCIVDRHKTAAALHNVLLFLLILLLLKWLFFSAN